MMIRHASLLQSAQWLARGVFAAALLSACGQDSPASTTSSIDDLSSAYELLSRNLQACEDEQEACTTAAAGDAAKIAACDEKAAACMAKTKGAEANAKKRLCDEAEGCARGRGGRGGRDDDGGPGDRRDCMGGGRGPRGTGNSACMDQLFECLDKAGIRSSNPQLTDAEKAAITACAETAHKCFMDDMAEGRRRGRGGRPDGAAGARPPRPEAGAAAPKAGSDGRGRGDRNEAGSDGRGRGDEAGSDGRGRGAKAGEGGRDRNEAGSTGRGRRDGQGGAGGS